AGPPHHGHVLDRHGTSEVHLQLLRLGPTALTSGTADAVHRIGRGAGVGRRASRPPAGEIRDGGPGGGDTREESDPGGENGPQRDPGSTRHGCLRSPAPSQALEFVHINVSGWWEYMPQNPGHQISNKLEQATMRDVARAA